ncbi:hypothetical protein SAMN02910298_01245 [Pseudobutyrivibrio sp. YE44]|uniref:fibronectin type III domain-containing protein n=1 Tax=Pseudobutyrivibrio sp. YE44 TaxID=1520802 RepID=UPI00088E7035|nr:fibronectin type III domain-containing protein [Pseudobutyrivibrio sp. YE44]SDB24871.1 hypothetical protein SAMN02910298_01245 [Pseudobutyrivibrio sp. YE44]
MRGKSLVSNYNAAQRLLALAVAAAMTLTMWFSAGISFADAVDGESVISSIQALNDEVAVQHLQVGAEESDIVFPDSFTATLETTREVVVEEEVQVPVENGAPVVGGIVAPTVESTELPVDPEAEPEEPASEPIEGTTDEPQVPATEPTEPVSEPTAGEEPVNEPTSAPVSDSVPAVESAPASEPAAEDTSSSDSAPASEGSDPIAYIIDRLFPAMVVKAAEEEPVDETPAEEPADTEEPAAPAEETLSPAVHETTVQRVETVTTSSEITLPGVTWTLDAERSSAAEFDSSVEGAEFVYVANIPTSYQMNAAIPTIKVIIGEEQKAEVVAAFTKSVVVDGVTITVKADEGVFPADATVSARTATEEEKNVFDTAVENTALFIPVVKSYVYDIKVLNAAGEAIQPDTTIGGAYVSFESEEMTGADLDASIYHIPGSETGNTVAEKLSTTKTGNVLEASAGSFSLYGVVTTPVVGTNVFDNSSYPYMVSQNYSEVKLAVRLSGEATSIKWYKTTEKKRVDHVPTKDNLDSLGTWVPVTNNDKDDANITLTGDTITNGAWYVCVVNGNVSEPVQLLGSLSTSDRVKDVFDRVWTQPMMPYYLSNGVMAYGVKGSVFDVTGYLPNLNLMIQTAYSSGWQMKSTDEIDPERSSGTAIDPDNIDLYVSFGGDGGYAVFFDANLKNGQKSFSFGCDTQLADRTLLGKYADSAALFAEKDNNGYLDYVAMVGAATKTAPDDTPAFLIKPITKDTVKFWIGYYGQSYSGHYDYNDNYLDGCTTGSVKYDSNTTEDGVALAVTDTDSGMTMSWRNKTNIKFQFSVGDVASTVAKVGGNVDYVNGYIKGLEKDTTYVVTYTDGGVQHSYEITSDATNGYIPLSGTDYDLTGQTVVIEKKNPSEGDVASDPISIESRPATPNFDTTGTDDDGDADKPADVGTDVITTTANSITVKSETENCQYSLYKYDEDGNEILVQDWDTPTNGTYVFNGLDEGTEYTIKSRIKPTSTKPGSLPSEGVKVTTKSTVSLATPVPSGTITTDYDEDGTGVSYPVVAETEGAKVEYSTNPNTNYSESLPTFKDAGTYTVYYKVSKEGCTPVYGSYEVTINKQTKEPVEIQETTSIPAEGTTGGTIDLSDYLGAGPELVDYEVDGDIAPYVTNVSMVDGKITYNVDNSPAGTTGTLRVKVQGTNDNPYWITIPLVSKAKPAPAPVEDSSEPAPAPAPAPVAVKPVVEEIPTVPVIEPVVETETETEKTPVVEQLLDIAAEVLDDTLGKGEIIDKGDIWGDMSDDTKTKLLDKLSETGGEIVKIASETSSINAALAEVKADNAAAKDGEDNNKVPVKEKPIALVMGEGAVVVKLETPENSRNTAGLADAKAVAKSILTEEQYAMVAAGSILEIKVEVLPLEDETIPELDKQVITDGVAAVAEEKPNLSMADYIDISMFMRIDDEDWNQITDTDPIDIVVDIPENYKGLSDTYYIMRAHEGVSTLLEDKDGNSDTITISTGQFSTYALMYDEPQTAIAKTFTSSVAAEKCHLCHLCPTFLGICYFVWIAIITVAAIVIMLYVSLRRKNENA